MFMKITHSDREASTTVQKHDGREGANGHMHTEANRKQNQRATRTQRRPTSPNLRILVHINKHKCKMNIGQPKGTLNFTLKTLYYHIGNKATGLKVTDFAKRLQVSRSGPTVTMRLNAILMEGLRISSTNLLVAHFDVYAH